MGSFGGPHIDQNDFVAGFSCATCLSDLQEGPGREPGRLHFLGQGVWVRLEYMTQLFFSGLLRHGGTAPLVPDDQEIYPWETRMMLISYPSTPLMTGTAKLAYSAQPFSNHTSDLAPEMTGAPTFNQDGKKWSGYANYGQDGWITMEDVSLFNFMVRGALQKVHHDFRQLPPSLDIQIDSRKFLDAFSVVLDGKRVSPEPWEKAPDTKVQAPFSERHRPAQDALLKVLFDHLMQGIPSVRENKYSGWDVTTQQMGGRPGKGTSGTFCMRFDSSLTLRLGRAGPSNTASKRPVTDASPVEENPSKREYTTAVQLLVADCVSSQGAGWKTLL